MSVTDYLENETPPLFEDAETGDRLLIYNTEWGARVELRHDREGLWLTQAKMAELFGRDESVISRHIAHVIEDGELSEARSLHFVQTPGSPKPVASYSLDMVISVGYRVNSAQATLFRRWATAVLVRFATQGFAVDAERMTHAGERDHIKDVRKAIRVIRASGQQVHNELKSICAVCQDYDGRSEAARAFLKSMQEKLFYAAIHRRPSEMFLDQAAGAQARSPSSASEETVDVAATHFTPAELVELNRLTMMLLDVIEDQLDVGRLTTMEEATRLLNNQMEQSNRIVLRGRHGESDNDNSAGQAR